MKRTKKWWVKIGRIPIWNFHCWYGGRCKWYKWWQEWKKDDDDTAPDDMEEGENYIHDDKNQKNGG